VPATRCLGRARAKAAGRLQRVLEAHRGVPPIQHRRGVRQDLALQLPEAGIAVAQHRRRRLRTHACHGERPPERLGRGHLAVADKGKTVLGVIGTDHLARDHLEAAPLSPVPVAHVAAVQPDHDRARRLHRGLVLEFDGARLHDFRADAQRPVAHRAGVLRPAERQQLGQQGGDLAERRQRRIPGRHVGQFGGDRIAAKIERGNALRPALAPARADKQAPDPHWHVAEQGAERRPVVPLGGQPAPARLARARALAYGGYLRRDHLGLQRRREPLRLVQPQPEIGQADVLVALDAGKLRFGDNARMPLRNQLHPPLQLRHPPALAP